LDDAERLLATWAEPWSPVAYVTLHDDGLVSIICHRSEMGQGSRTTMPMIIADEMEADWSKCRVQQADGNEKKYGSQNTDGSTSIRNFLPRYREAGATMRALLEDAAAADWGVNDAGRPRICVPPPGARPLRPHRGRTMPMPPGSAAYQIALGTTVAGQGHAIGRLAVDDRRHGQVRRGHRARWHEDRRHRTTTSLGRHHPHGR
jgi:hypothetical protein